jgi:outer membrane protein assembly factor BamB
MRMDLKRPLAAIAAVAALSACASVERASSAVWPFGRDQDSGPKAPEDGRISILTFEQKLEADKELASRRPIIPLAGETKDWSLPGGQADNAPQHIAHAGSFKVAWRRDVVEGSSRTQRLSASPVIAGGRAFLLGADQSLSAVNAATGAAIWKVELRQRDTRDRVAIGGGVAVADGKVFVTSGFGLAAAFDAETGRELWRTRSNSPFAAAPTAVGGRVFAVTSDSELIAMSATDGAVLWTHQAIAEPARILSSSSPAVVGDIVIAPFASGEVIALLAANGRRLWVDALTRAGRMTSLSAINDVSGRPVALEGQVYAVSHSGVLAAIDQRSGQRVWARGLASTQTPWAAGDALYVVSVDGELAALERTTGRAFWVTQLQRFRDEDDKKGRIAWTGPIMVGGKLLLASSEGEVAIVSPDTGAIESTVEVGTPVFVPPIAAGDTVYLLGDDGRLIALR